MRLWNALLNSISAWRHLIRHERAFRQEVGLLVVSLPAGWILAEDLGHFAILIGSLMMLIVVETLNTGIEAACNAVTREFHQDIKLAKDCGSLAVLMVIVIVVGVWGIALYGYVAPGKLPFETAHRLEQSPTRLALPVRGALP
jgi:diacylglycerol kinase (ATP)